MLTSCAVLITVLVILISRINRLVPFNYFNSLACFNRFNCDPVFLDYSMPSHSQTVYGRNASSNNPKPALVPKTPEKTRGTTAEPKNPAPLTLLLPITTTCPIPTSRYWISSSRSLWVRQVLNISLAPLVALPFLTPH